MSLVLTLVASTTHQPLTNRHIGEVQRLLGLYQIQPTCAPVWLAPQQAVDLGISAKPDGKAITHLREFLDRFAIDVFVVPIENRRKKLLLADMDSTIVQGETLDALAAYGGVQEQVAAITKRVMEGEVDFADALRERVHLLKGLDVGSLQKTADALQINPGALQLVKTMRKNGAACILISGGFTFFTQVVAERLGFTYHYGNVLKITENRLEGAVEEPILDQSSKLELLLKNMHEYKLKPADVLAIGDGANDIPMLKAAGLGIGYHPKSVVAEAVPNVILHGNLTAVLFAQGYTINDIGVKNA
ncbi:MAG: phosphoserine phosphatase SerB [Alphaproteobacteria bacterium]|nr:phosphoserine phosphatase SerB [Alphaproteobacteria bacterium]